jgi:hypothetical protein
VKSNSSFLSATQSLAVNVDDFVDYIVRYGCYAFSKAKKFEVRLDQPPSVMGSADATALAGLVFFKAADR